MMRHRVQPPHPAVDNLILAGPRMLVIVGLHPADAAPFHDRGEVPPSDQVSLMIDTGATVTLIDDSVPVSMGLAPSRFQPIMFGDGKPQLRPVYLVSISILMEDDAGRSVLESFEGTMVGMDARSQGHGGLMGRDFLSNFRFKYDGPNGTFELGSDRDQEPEMKELRRRERREKKQARKQRKKSR